MNPKTTLWPILGFIIAMTLLVTRHYQEMKKLDVQQYSTENLVHKEQTKRW